MAYEGYSVVDSWTLRNETFQQGNDFSEQYWAGDDPQW